MSLLLAVAMLLVETAPPFIEVSGADGSKVEVATQDEDADEIDRAWNLLGDKKPAEAIAAVDPLIAKFEAENGKRAGLTFCARTMTESILYAGLAAAKKQSGVVLHRTPCSAHFIKGFALIDLGRHADAKFHLDRAVELSPMNSKFLAERAEWYKTRRDWPNALVDFEKALEASDFGPDDAQNAEKARALRGIAFVKIEQGSLDEAEKLLKESLNLDPDSTMARGELDYIKQLRAR